MGLDMYLGAKKRLNKKSKIDRQYIQYFNTLSESIYDKEDNGYAYISEYFNTKDIHAHLATLPKLRGQVGSINRIKPDGDSYIVVTEAGYWRKANQVHNWFVKNVQDGVDNCGTYNVSRETLSQLLDDCNKVVNESCDPADVLPSVDGFFFGGTDYDEWYYEDVANTVQKLEPMVDEYCHGTSYGLYYCSSW